MTPAAAPLATSAVADRMGRPLRDVRISVTDRCNFRCHYCMPREVFGPGHGFLPKDELLSFDEIALLVEVLAGLGVHKVRLTGGEPLLRHDLDQLVAMVAAVPGIDDLALTTNGVLLAAQADRLRRAGLGRVTVSLDSLDPAVFARMADTTVPLARVLEGIAAAVEAGFRPVKLNTVVQRGVNDDGLLDLVDYARRGGHVLRFIEYMDVGTTNGWLLDQVVPAVEIRDAVEASWPLIPVASITADEVARRYRFADGAGEVGFVTSVSEPFCGTCSRARLTSTGELYTCLFAGSGTDLRGLLRSGAGVEAVRQRLAELWQARTDRYSELRGRATGATRVEMSYVGG